ncbi:type VI secretion system baseplate subunit TssK [Dyella sp. M7H15-1]|uniref:type VI secretion system baseplate subunit TssK n=1 Tax=Dyella sp. M7H15-1 TaxID=2501295 RepID=UPI001004EF4D|nr:type VI secretion system baseplate subunit TssK [Dyella sp. M7H15-1]QAU23558.1 type VI secretion system baseplate subunit TssK [Dyella sp. M7H15-1]
MKITRPLWAKGIFMSPQHFQQQGLWNSLCDEQVARIASPDPWGVQGVAFDKQALSVERVQVSALTVRLPDGTWIDTDIVDRLPPARNLHDVPKDVDAVDVLVGLPLIDPQGSNCIEDGQKPARPRRFVGEYLHVADLHGDGKDEISVERHALALLFHFEQHDDYVTCPVGRFVRNTQGRFEADAAFVPPCLVLSANDHLTARMQRLSEILAAKSASLAQRRKERSDKIADYAVADVSLFWLLHSVNTTWPALARLAQAPDQHPERLYAVLASLAGSLLTFSMTDTLQSIPSYDHRAPETVFAKLEALIRTLLDTVIPSSVVPITLDRPRATSWAGQFNDPRLVENTDYYLAVRASMPAHELLEIFPRLCKIGAPDDVQHIVNSALPGIPLRPASRLPAAIPVRIENHYFALDSAHPAFKRMTAAHACQIYVPTSIPDASLELYAVLPA